MSSECRYPCGCDRFPEEHCSCMDGHTPTPVPSEVAETTAGEREVEALAKALADHADCVANDSRSREWIDGSGVTGIDVWSCGIEVPYADDMDTMARLHIAHALAARDDRVRREEGERIAQAIEGIRTHDDGVRSCIERAARIAREESRAASVGRGEGA